MSIENEAGVISTPLTTFTKLGLITVYKQEGTLAAAAREVSRQGGGSFESARSQIRRALGTHEKPKAKSDAVVAVESIENSIDKVNKHRGTELDVDHMAKTGEIREPIQPASDFVTDKKIGQINWREGLELATGIINGKRKASFNNSSARIEFPDRPRVDFINLGDLHFFSSGTDHDALIRLTDAILAEPNLYIVCLGDIIENAINLRGVAEVQSNLMPTGYQLAIYEDWLNTIKHRVLFATHDNHASERFEKNAGVDFFGWITGRMVPFFDGIAHVDIKLGEQEYKLMATHKMRGRSMMNPTHGQQRYGRFDAQDREILLAADSHVPGISKYQDGDRKKLAVNVGTMNVKSAYARRYFSVYSSPVFPVVSLYRDTHDFSAFWSLEEWSACFGNAHSKN